MKVFNSEEDQ